MKIVACIKYSLDVSEIKVNPETKALRLDAVPRKVGNIDQHVLEAAVSLQEAYGGSVHALTFAPAVDKEHFREVLAMGVDEVILVESPFADEVAPSVTARVLAAAIEKLGDVDLVLCGEVSDDGFTYQVPPRLAERLDLPLIAYARTLGLEDGSVTADRDLDDRAQTVTAPLPAVVSVVEELNAPRRPTLMQALKAKQKPVHHWQLAEDLSLSPEELAADKKLERIERTGVVVNRKRQILAGDDLSALANQLLDILEEEGVLEVQST